MNYNEAEIEAAKVEEEENLKLKLETKIAVVHDKTILETTMKGNHLKIVLIIESYIDETNIKIINKKGKKIEKFRVREYLNDGGGRTKNPDYDEKRIIALDLPGYLKS